MNVIIPGSGGCVSAPRACCSCRACTEARQKGFPYARTGCSLFIEDVNTRYYKGKAISKERRLPAAPRLTR